MLPQQVDQHRQHQRGDDREQHHEQAAESATKRADLQVPKAHAARLTADTNRKPSRWSRRVDRTPDSMSGGLPDSTHRVCLPCLIIRLIIQTIRQDRSGSDQIDDPSDVSRPDPSGAVQIDAEHQATDLAVGVRIPRGAPVGSTV